jgi:hypothetical protein
MIEGFHLLDMDPLEVARQMTLIDQKLWQEVRPYEYLTSPSLALIAFFP